MVKMSDIKTYKDKPFRVFFFNGYSVVGKCDITTDSNSGGVFIADKLNGVGPVYMIMHKQSFKIETMQKHIIEYVLKSYSRTRWEAGTNSIYTLDDKYKNKMVIHIGNSTVLHDMKNETELTIEVMKLIGKTNFDKFTDQLREAISIDVERYWRVEGVVYSGFSFKREMSGAASMQFKQYIAKGTYHNYQSKRSRAGIGRDEPGRFIK